MDLNPYAEDVRRCDTELAAAEDVLRHAETDIEDYDTGGAAGQRDLAEALVLVARRQEQATATELRLREAQRSLAAFNASPGPSPKKSVTWKHVLVGAGAMGLMATGAGAAYGAAMLGEMALTMIVGGTAGGVLGGGLGAALANETNEQNKRQANAEWEARGRDLQNALRSTDAECRKVIDALAAAQAAANEIATKVRAAAERRSTRMRADYESVIAQAMGERDARAQERAEAHADYADLDGKIAPLKSKLHELDREIYALDRDREVAESFLAKLEAASTGFERAQVHASCRERFESRFPAKIAGSPSDVVKAVGGQTEPLRRTRKKLIQEVQDKARVHKLHINRVVIDGCNLCYERTGTTIVGLPPLRAVCTALRDQSFEVLVAFDASIRRRLQIPRRKDTTAWLREALGAEIQVKVAPDGLRADEIVLAETSDSQSAALTNDKFQEADVFKGRYTVQSEGRVFRHVITAPTGNTPGQVNIPSFSIFATWT